MRSLISLRAILCLITITGGIKIILPMFEGTHATTPEQDLNIFSFVKPSLAATAPKEKEVSEMAEVKEPMQCEKPEAMLLAISRERELLEVQTSTLKERKASVALAEEKLKQDTIRLSDLKKDLEDLLRKVEDAKSDDLKRLIAIYSNMKPKEAANIMNTLDIEVAVMVLGQMKERDVAPIFAKLNTVRSQAISKIILERSKLPGDQKLNGISLQ